MKWIDKLFKMALMFLLLFLGYKANEHNKNIKALAYNIYFEARNSSLEDQIATAVVVMNRGEPYIEVYKPYQFSWTADYKSPADNKEYRRALRVASMVYYHHDLFKSKDICKHYTVLKDYPKGHWTHKFKRRTKIGKHYYYCN